MGGSSGKYSLLIQVLRLSDYGVLVLKRTSVSLPTNHRDQHGRQVGKVKEP